MPDNAAPAPPAAPPAQLAQLAQLQAQLDQMRAALGAPAPAPKSPAETVADAKAAVAKYASESHGATASSILITILSAILAVLEKLTAPQAVEAEAPAADDN